MASNRLFIFDPKQNRAICIAKGYSVGWSNGKGDYIDKWLDATEEYTGNIDKTRLKLITESELNKNIDVTYEP